MITLNAIAKRLEEFGTNHFFIKSYSFGSPDDVDLDKFQDFPLMHVVYTGSDYEERTKTFSFEVYVFDRPNREEQMTINQREVVSDAQQCLEDIIADVENGGNIFLFDENYQVLPPSITPLIDERSNLLTGALLDLTIQVPYQRDACNLPIDGVQSAGGEISYRRRGILRVRTQDGTTDVQSVNEIRVTNGTLTDEGDGVVSIDTGSATIDALDDIGDVNLDDPQDHEALVYDQDTATWINGASTKIGIRVINQTGGTLFRGSPVKAVGVQGDQIQVAVFSAASDDGKRFVGLLDSDLANGATGYARQTGMIYHLNTSAFNVGDILYPTNQGVVTIDNGLDFMQAFPPNGSAGGTPVTIAAAIVVRKHANTGRVYVRTWTPSLSLGALDDVNLDVAVLGDPNTLVYDGSKWIKGTPSMLLSSLRNVSQGTDDPPVGSILTWNNSTSEWIATPKASFLPSADAYFLNRYTFEAIAARQAADATLTIERYLSVQADGHGEEVSAQTDTPTSGNKIIRKIWHKAVSFEDSDVSTWTLVHTFADDTAYADTTATFDALLTAATYGSIPFSLAQTWEELPAFDGLLDTYTGAAAAYSLRLLDSTYTGDAIRVRRASDNAEQDIGFVDNELDTSTLATFCAGTDGFVKTWYDQSGNANDATQTSTSLQPKIYDASTGVLLESGKPAIQFDGNTLVFNSVSAQSAFITLNSTSVSANPGMIGSSSGSNFGFYSAGAGVRYRTNTNYDFPSLSMTGYYLNSYVVTDALSLTVYQSGIPASEGSVTVNSVISVELIMSRSTLFLGGNLQEVVIYSSDQSANRTGIETNINTAFSIYGQSPTGFLADYPGAAAAYSLRQLISTATYAVAVRRDSDDAVLPIGFVDGELDTTTLAAFCSGTDGFVAVWFDQSGEGNHATQTTTSAQPKIYDASTGVELDNVVATLRFDGTDDKFPIDTSSYDIGSLSSFLVGTLRTGTGVMLALSGSGGNKRWYAPYADSSNFNYGYGGSTTAIQGTKNTNQNLHTMIAGTTLGGAEAWLNGASQGTASLDTGMDATQSAVGNLGNGFYAAANISAVIIYNDDKSADRTAIETALNDYFNIY